MAWDGYTIAVVVILASFISVPLVFFTWLTWRLCFDKSLQRLFDQATDKGSCAENLEQESGNGEQEDANEDKPPSVLLTYQKVRYAVPVGNGEEKLILKGVSGYFKPGSLTAIMGPSGCGKSTLLDILADQKEYGTISGDIRINGELRTPLFRRATAYVMQFDVLYPMLTPRETLFFVTELRLGSRMSSAKKRQRVEETLRDLDLLHVADTRIGAGESGGGLSGGQKRRLTVAIELVTGPGLILLDEPTSGLDSYGSLQLVSVLRKLADAGRTIACTIHQPRADIFNMFDNLVLLGYGVTMYFGPVKKIFPYFEGLGVEVDYEVNPADFIVDLTQQKSEEEKLEEKALVAKLLETQRAQELEDAETRKAWDEEFRALFGEEWPMEEEEEVQEDSNDAGDVLQVKPVVPQEDPNGKEDAKKDVKKEEGSELSTLSSPGQLEHPSATDSLESSSKPTAAGPPLQHSASELERRRQTFATSQRLSSAFRATEFNLDVFCAKYDASKENRAHKKFLRNVHKKTEPNVPPPLEEVYGVDSSSSKGSDFAASFLKQAFTLGRRSIINDLRNSSYMIGNWVIGPIMMLFYGALYSNVETPSTVRSDEVENILAAQNSCQLNNTYLGLYDPPESINSLTTCGEALNFDEQLSFVRASLIYQFMAAAYFSEGPYVPQVNLDKRMFYREYAAKSYSIAAYHFSFYVRMFFAAFCKGLVFPVFGYFSASLSVTAEAYFLFSIFFGSMSACGASMALLCATVFPGLEIAQSVFVLINIIAQSLSGYWIVELYIGWWFRWMYYINLFRYAFEGAVYAQSLPSNGDLIFDDTSLSLRTTCWLFAMIVLVFAIALQFFAFLANYLTHQKPATDYSKMVVEEDDDEDDETDTRDSFERMTSASSAKDANGNLRGYTRLGLVNRYRDWQRASVRFVPEDQGPRANQINTTLANNGGTIFATEF